jgi:tol-pal system protein YbgF
MRSIGRLAGAAIVLTLAVPAVAGAANKEHQLLMAEIRMLQEQQQQLQQMLGGLADTLKVMTTRLDSDADNTRKAFADQKLLVGGIGDAVRVLREKADDTNVRLSTMTQELQALRQAVASMPSAQAPLTPSTSTDPTTGEPAPSSTAPAGSPSAAGSPSSANISPTRMYDQSYADYSAGQYDLAIEGFQAFIRTFPTSPNADEAQLYVGYSLYNAGKNAEAVAALQKVITDYPQSNSVSSAYYKLGLTYEALKQPDAARKAFETVVQKYPSSYDAVLAQQALERLKRRDDLDEP